MRLIILAAAGVLVMPALALAQQAPSGQVDPASDPEMRTLMQEQRAIRAEAALWNTKQQLAKMTAERDALQAKTEPAKAEPAKAPTPQAPAPIPADPTH